MGYEINQIWYCYIYLQTCTLAQSIHSRCGSQFFRNFIKGTEVPDHTGLDDQMTGALQLEVTPSGVSGLCLLQTLGSLTNLMISWVLAGSNSVEVLAPNTIFGMFSTIFVPNHNN